MVPNQITIFFNGNGDKDEDAEQIQILFDEHDTMVDVYVTMKTAGGSVTTTQEAEIVIEEE